MSEMPREIPAEITEVEARPADYEQFEPAFRQLAQDLNCSEGEEAREWHIACARGECDDDQHYIQCVTHYARLAHDSHGYYGVTLEDTDVLHTVYKASFGIADIHFQSGHYDSCLLELERLTDLMRVTKHDKQSDVQQLVDLCHQRLLEQGSSDSVVANHCSTDVGYSYFPKLTELALPVLAKRRGFDETAGTFDMRRKIVSLHKELEVLPPNSDTANDMYKRASVLRKTYIESAYRRTKIWTGDSESGRRRFAEGRDIMLALLYYQIKDSDCLRTLSNAIKSLKENDDWLDRDIIESVVSHLQAEEAYQAEF